VGGETEISLPALLSGWYFFFLGGVLGLELRVYALSHATSPFFCVLDIFEIGSLKLFA
jgi:hypothetical protein